jgi:hypothetical protein
MENLINTTIKRADRLYQHILILFVGKHLFIIQRRKKEKVKMMMKMPVFIIVGILRLEIRRVEMEYGPAVRAMIKMQKLAQKKSINLRNGQMKTQKNIFMINHLDILDKIGSLHQKNKEVLLMKFKEEWILSFMESIVDTLDILLNMYLKIHLARSLYLPMKRKN